MGYACYVLPDGRWAGYGIEAECDRFDCRERINRGLGYLCGGDPDGWRSGDEPGCGMYFCEAHSLDHDCPNPGCGVFEGDGDGCCGRCAGHDSPHRDAYDGHEFTVTEGDLVGGDGMVRMIVGG